MSGNCNSLPQSWVHAALEDCCHIILGQSPPGESYNDSGKGMPFFQGKADFGELYPTVRKWCTQPGKTAEKDDALISVRAPVGPTNLCAESACIGRGLAALRSLGGCAPRYILYALRNTQAQLAAQGAGSTFEAITGDQLRAHRIPIAPKEEQHRIVEEIEKQFTRLDDAVAALKRVQANLRRYRASVLKAACEGGLVPTEAELARKEGRSYESGEQLLARIRRENGAQPGLLLPETGALPVLPKGWTWASLGQCFTVERGRFAIRPRNDPRYYGGDHPFVQIGDLPRDGGPIAEASQSLNAQGLRVSKKFTRGTVLIAIVGATIGSTGVLAFDSCCPDSLVALQSQREVLLEFAEFYLRSKKIEIRTTSYASGGQPNINLRTLLPYPIPLPPEAELHRIVDELERRLSKVKEMDRYLAASLQRCGSCRSSILRRAFSGKLVPPDPNDEPASVLLERIRAERPAAAPRPARRAARARRQ